MQKSIKKQKSNDTEKRNDSNDNIKNANGGW